MTIIQRATYAAGAWVRRENPPRAIMPVNVLCAGPTESLTLDLARAWSRRLRWGKYGSSVFAADSLPYGTPPADNMIGALIVTLSAEQEQPFYADGNPSPDTAIVRVVLNQPISFDSPDNDLLVSRREDVRQVVHTTSGEVS